MPLSENTKTDVLRLLKYEVLGLYQQSPAGGSWSYGARGFRYFTEYGDLLFIMNWLRPIEEAKLTGQATGWISFSGQNPSAGDSITVTLSGTGIIGGPIVVTVTVPPVLPVGATPWDLNTIAQAFASGFAAQPAFLANGFSAVADYGQNPGSQQRVAVPICSINAPNGFGSFNLAMTFTGTTAPYVTQVAVPVAPFITFVGVTGPTTIYGLIPILNTMEGAYGGEMVTLSASEANGTKLRHNVLDKRIEQIEYYRRELSDFLGIAINRPASGGCGSVSF